MKLKTTENRWTFLLKRGVFIRLNYLITCISCVYCPISFFFVKFLKVLSSSFYEELHFSAPLSMSQHLGYPSENKTFPHSQNVEDKTAWIFSSISAKFSDFCWKKITFYLLTLIKIECKCKTLYRENADTSVLRRDFRINNACTSDVNNPWIQNK